MHLVIDGYGGDAQCLADEASVYAILDRYPTIIGMTKIAPPSVHRYHGGKPLDWGVSGFVLIAESHISIHTFPERGLIWVDIFSCKGFDGDQAVEYVRAQFNLTDTRVRLLERELEPEQGHHGHLAAAQERQRVSTALRWEERPTP